MKVLYTILVAIVLLSVEAVLVKYLRLQLVRIDVTVALIAFLSLRASTQAGALSSFAIGYLLDLMSGRPTGLYLFLAVLLFLVGRLGASLVDVRSGPMFALYAMGLDALHALLAFFFVWMTAGTELGGPVIPLAAIPFQVALTGIAALLLYPLLRRLDPGDDRRDVGALR